MSKGDEEGQVTEAFTPKLMDDLISAARTHGKLQAFGSLLNELRPIASLSRSQEYSRAMLDVANLIDRLRQETSKP